MSTTEKNQNSTGKERNDDQNPQRNRQPAGGQSPDKGGNLGNDPKRASEAGTKGGETHGKSARGSDTSGQDRDEQQDDQGERVADRDAGMNRGGAKEQHAGTGRENRKQA
jgi:general stress protein YciG